MDDFQLGWIVGLYEGEGCFTAGGDRKIYRIRITMKDLEPLERAAEVTGVGHIQGPRYTGPLKSGEPNLRPFWRWQVSTRQHIDDLITLMYPHLSPRRQSQIVAVLEKCNREELLCVLS